MSHHTQPHSPPPDALTPIMGFLAPELCAKEVSWAMVLNCSKQNRTKTNAVLLGHYETAHESVCVVARAPDRTETNTDRREGTETRVLQRALESHFKTA